MAKPSWLIINPTQGSGNGTTTNSANAHTGRVARTGIVTVTGVGVSTPATYRVIQEPKAEFASYDNGTEMSANKDAGKVTITGKSNSSKLTFSWLGDSHNVSLPSSYSAGGITTNNLIDFILLNYKLIWQKKQYFFTFLIRGIFYSYLLKIHKR